LAGGFAAAAGGAAATEVGAGAGAAAGGVNTNGPAAGGGAAELAAGAGAAAVGAGVGADVAGVGAAGGADGGTKASGAPSVPRNGPSPIDPVTNGALAGARLASGVTTTGELTGAVAMMSWEGAARRAVIEQPDNSKAASPATIHVVAGRTAFALPSSD
jgi:hypothetical protein